MRCGRLGNGGLPNIMLKNSSFSARKARDMLMGSEGLLFDYLVVKQGKLRQKSDLHLQILPCHNKCCSVALSALDVPSSGHKFVSLRLIPPSAAHTRPIPSISPTTDRPTNQQPNNQQAPSSPSLSPLPGRQSGKKRVGHGKVPFFLFSDGIVFDACSAAAALRATLPLSPEGLFLLLIL